MNGSQPECDIERWLAEAGAGLGPDDAKIVRAELERHLCDLFKSEMAVLPHAHAEHEDCSEELAAWIGAINPSKREDLRRAVHARAEILRQGLAGARKVSGLACFSLSMWIETATRGLCDDAKARISTEIEAHYTDAFKDATARGLRETAAHLEVIIGLGDPFRARRAFRRTHLTAAEDRLLRGILVSGKPSKWKYFDMTLNLAAVIPFLLKIAANGGHVWLAAISLCLCLPAGIVMVRLLAPYLFEKKRFWPGLAAYQLGMLLTVVPLFAVIFHAYSKDITSRSAEPLAVFAVAVVVLTFGTILICLVRIGCKLHRRSRG
jgi:hypothetical protein